MLIKLIMTQHTDRQPAKDHMGESRGTDSRPILTPRERRQRNRHEMITLILDVAREMMRDEGVAALNLNEIARRMGMTTPALYGYFPSKAALYDALFQQAVHGFMDTDAAAWTSDGSGWDRVRAWFEARIDFAEQYPELYDVALGRLPAGFVPSEQTVTLIEQSRLLLLRRITELIDAGVIAPGMPADRAADMLLAMRHGLIAEHVAKHRVRPDGTHRFRGLIDDVMTMVRKAWAPLPGERMPCAPGRAERRDGSRTGEDKQGRQ